MQCEIRGKVGTGTQCPNQATTRNVVGHFVCEECKVDGDRIAALLHDLAVRCGYKPVTPDPRNPVTHRGNN